MRKPFNLRDLFWLMLVVGIATGWWIDRAKFTASVQVLGENIIRLEKKANQQFWADVWLPPPGSPVRDGFQVDVF